MNYAEHAFAEELRKLNLSEAPKLRYEDIPKPAATPDYNQLVNHEKAKLLVDPILTAKFERYIPLRLEIDQSIDTRAFKHGWSYGFCVRRDVPVPVNDKITRSTGLTADADEGNLMHLLGREILNYGNLLGTKRIGPPLVWATRGDPKIPEIVPLLGVIVKYDRTPPQGIAAEDMIADLGVMVPWDQSDKLKS